MRYALTALLWLYNFPAHATSPQCVEKNLSGLFIDPPTRHQGDDVGSCHAFSIIALVEAAFADYYGVRIHLAEADLFVRHQVLSRDYIMEARPEHLSQRNQSPEEGANMIQDFDFIKKNGVATEKLISYRKVLDRYRKYRRDIKAVLGGVSKPRPLYDPRLDALNGQSSPQIRALTQRYLLGDSAEISHARDVVRQALAGFQLGGYAEGQDIPSSTWSMKDFLIENLCLNRPVLVAVDLVDLKNWGIKYADPTEPDPLWQEILNTKNPAFHGIVIQGFRKWRGQYVFFVRNSWGGINPPILEKELGKIDYALTIWPPAHPPHPQTIAELKTLARQ